MQPEINPAVNRRTLLNRARLILLDPFSGYVAFIQVPKRARIVAVNRCFRLHTFLSDDEFHCAPICVLRNCMRRARRCYPCYSEAGVRRQPQKARHRVLHGRATVNGKI